MSKNILIVEDDTNITNLLSPLFAKRNYDTIIAEDAETALEMIHEKIPDLILSDVTMPGMDGFEFYHKLRENPQTAATPFIFMTGIEAATDQLKGLQIGAYEFVTKPFNLKTLFGTIENVFAKAEKQQTD